MAASNTSINEILRQFGRSEGLFRATALTANVIMTSLIANIAGFGHDGLLVSATVHLAIGAALEIPTGLYSDRFGPPRAVQLGLWLKLLTTVSFFVATYFALQLNTAVAVTFLAIEATIDAFANSLLSGAYQAAYLVWYRQSISANGLNQADAPPLFLASFRFALKWLGGRENHHSG